MVITPGSGKGECGERFNSTIVHDVDHPCRPAFVASCQRVGRFTIDDDLCGCTVGCGDACAFNGAMQSQRVDLTGHGLSIVDVLNLARL